MEDIFDFFEPIFLTCFSFTWLQVRICFLMTRSYFFPSFLCFFLSFRSLSPSLSFSLVRSLPLLLSFSQNLVARAHRERPAPSSALASLSAEAIVGGYLPPPPAPRVLHRDFASGAHTCRELPNSHSNHSS
jgi:hypothetical protein